METNNLNTPDELDNGFDTNNQSHEETTQHNTNEQGENIGGQDNDLSDDAANQEDFPDTGTGLAGEDSDTEDDYTGEEDDDLDEGEDPDVLDNETDGADPSKVSS